LQNRKFNKPDSIEVYSLWHDEMKTHEKTLHIMYYFTVNNTGIETKTEITDELKLKLKGIRPILEIKLKLKLEG